jgi:hypothetical protein
MRMLHSPERVCDLLIRTLSYIVLVKIRRTDRIMAPIREIGHECRGLIEELRLFPRSPQILLELWIYSKHGTYRFFRLREGGINEIDREGSPAPYPALDRAGSPIQDPVAAGAGTAGTITGEPVTAGMTVSDPLLQAVDPQVNQ